MHTTQSKVCGWSYFETISINMQQECWKRLCSRILEPCCRDLLPFRCRSFTEVRHRCQPIRPSLQLAFHFIPEGVWWGWGQALCRPVKYFYKKKIKLNQTVSFWACFCVLVLTRCNREGHSSDCCQRVGCTIIININSVTISEQIKTPNFCDFILFLCTF